MTSDQEATPAFVGGFPAATVLILESSFEAKQILRVKWGGSNTCDDWSIRPQNGGMTVASHLHLAIPVLLCCLD